MMKFSFIRKSEMNKAVSYNLLKTFTLCAKHGEFLAASRELNITPTAVSKNIRTLEEQLGIALFQRMHRKVSLTAAGASCCTQWPAPAMIRLNRKSVQLSSMPS